MKSDRMLAYTDDTEASRLTVLLLQQHNIAFKHIDTTGDRKLVATLSAAGYTTLPVVMIGGDVWTGYRPDKIRALLRRSGGRGRSA